MQMNPPVRDDAPSRTASGRASTQGVVDVLGSDHAPHTLEEKAKPYPDIAVRHDRACRRWCRSCSTT